MLETIKGLYQKLLIFGNWSQLVAIVLIVALAYFLSKRFIADKKASNFILELVYSLAFPFIALLLFVVSIFVATALSHPHNLLKYGITLSLAMLVIRTVVYLLHIIFPKAEKLNTWRNIIAITVWATAALYILGWHTSTIKAIETFGFEYNNKKITLFWLAKIVLTISIFVLAASWISIAIDRQLRRQKRIGASTKLAISKSIRVVLIALAILIGLDSIGVDLTTLTVFGGALGVGIGFGLQRIASNFISGFILLFDRSIRPGDVITIGKSFGWIQELRARYVVIRDRDGVDTLIPNENLITSQVINWSYGDRNVRQKLGITISYQDNVRHAMEIMINAAVAHPRVNAEPKAVCRLMDFADYGIKIELRYWICDPEEGVNNIRSEIALTIWDMFQEQGITIPYPQRDLHVKEIPAPIVQSKPPEKEND